MSLFAINRYEGENENEDIKNENHLSTLLQKIEERKRQREVSNLDNASAKKNKKNNQESDSLYSKDNDQAVTANNDQNKNISKSIITEETPKKKKKTKKTDKHREKLDESQNDKDENNISELKVDEENGEIKESDSNKQKINPADCGFTILSTGKQLKLKSIKRVLPQWLAQPNIISSNLQSGPLLEEYSCGLEPQFVKALKLNGVKRLFPVQSNVIPWLLKCHEDRKRGVRVRDTCICAPTGSGKTLVYALPIVQILKENFIKRVRCLIVLPVQELAAQVYKVLQTYAAETNLNVGLISGAYSFEEDQTKILRKRSNGEYMSLVDILVATPGRLVDHIEKTKGFSLDYLQFLIIDEADRATDWLQHIPNPHSKPPAVTLQNMKSNPIPPAQKILLSATLSQDPEKISRLGLFRPILFTTVAFSKDEDIDLDKLQESSLARFSIPENLTLRLVESPAEYKPLAVIQMLNQIKHCDKVLIFTNSGNSAHRLSILLQIMLKNQHIQVKELSSQLTPKQREETLNKFAESKFQILVSSDALARGLDIPGITMVISYDPPKYIKGLIHRIGRTGRAGLSGTAISIVTPNQLDFFSQLFASSHLTLPEVEKNDFEQLVESLNYSQHLEKLKQTLDEKQAKLSKRIKVLKRKHA